MQWLALLLLNIAILASAQSPSISSEGDPFQPVPAYEGFIVDSGHYANNSADGSSFIAAPGKIAKTDAVVTPASENLQPTLDECSRSCASTAGCTAFLYCKSGNGSCQGRTNVYPELGCELILQAESNANMTLPFMAIEQETTADLISGAPIKAGILGAGPIPAFGQLFAQSFYNKYDYDCDGTLINGSCALSGSPASLIDTCNGDPEQRCNLMVWYPDGRYDLGPNITFFKGGKGVTVDASVANLNQHGISYIRLGQATAASFSGGSSGLSDGAVAGIAIGSAVGGALLATGAMILTVKRRHRGHFLQLQHPKTDIESQRPSTIGNFDGISVLSSSIPHGSIPTSSIATGSGSSAAGLAAAAAAVTMELPQASASPNASHFARNAYSTPFDSSYNFPPIARTSEDAVIPTTARPSTRSASGALVIPLINSRTSPFDSPPLTRASGGTATTTAKPSTSSGSGERIRQQLWQQQQWQQQQSENKDQEIAEISPFQEAVAMYASSSTDHGRGRSSIDLRLETAARTASVLDAIKGAGWAHYNVDFGSIEWMQHSDGKLWELGHGAFSKVYKCSLDTTLVFAAKVIPLDNANAERVFLREAITLFHLRHPNVVQFSGVCIHDGRAILLMELMEGGTLFDNMGLRNSSNVRLVGWYSEGRRIALAIAQALHYLHQSLQIIHMDLKSANVLLTRDLTPKLADVGFSRVWASMDVSAKDSRIGTFAYMAPELLLGGSITSAADIYSFGVLLREMCTGEYPSRGRSRFPKVPEECPQEMADVIIACMKNEPKERPSAKELHLMLLRCPY